MAGMLHKWQKAPDWRHVVVLAAILALIACVATRTFQGFCFEHPVTHADAGHKKDQRLSSDAVEPIAPVTNMATMLLPVAAPHAPPAQPVLRDTEFFDALYNRPPPSAALL
jgi:hypothetical protein